MCAHHHHTETVSLPSSCEDHRGREDVLRGLTLVSDAEPNNESPLNAHAAAIWGKDEEFRKNVLKKHAEGSAQNSNPNK